MKTAEKVARARIKSLEEIDPKRLCCKTTREWFLKDAGMIVEIFPDQREGPIPYICEDCGGEHEHVVVRLVKPVHGCTAMPVVFIDIDEG